MNDSDKRQRLILSYIGPQLERMTSEFHFMKPVKKAFAMGTLAGGINKKGKNHRATGNSVGRPKKESQKRGRPKGSKNSKTQRVPASSDDEEMMDIDQAPKYNAIMSVTGVIGQDPRICVVSELTSLDAKEVFYLNADKYIDESALTFALIDYIKNDDRSIALLSPQFWAARLQSANSIDIQQFLILRSEDPPQYLLAPMWKDGHFYAVIFAYEGGDTARVYYCDSNRQPTNGFEKGLLEIYEFFQSIGNIPEHVGLDIWDYSTEAAYQDFDKDSLSCAARAAFNTIGCLNWLKTDVNDRDENNILDKSAKMNLLEFRTWLFALLMPLFGASNEEVTEEIARITQEYYAYAANNGLVPQDKDALDQMPAENANFVDDLWNYILENDDLIDELDAFEDDNRLPIAKDSIGYEDVLKDKSDILAGEIRTTLELSTIDEIQPQTPMPIDFITFIMLRYIEQDKRSIALLSPGYWIESMRERIKSDNPLDYLIVRPNVTPQFLIVPVFVNNHAVGAIMEYDATTDAIWLFYFDSSGDIDEETKKQLTSLASHLFVPIINTNIQIRLYVQNISEEALFKDSDVDNTNCVPYVAHYLAEFLDCKKLDIRDRNLRETTKTGIQMRLDLIYRLLGLFDLSIEHLNNRFDNIQQMHLLTEFNENIVANENVTAFQTATQVLARSFATQAQSAIRNSYVTGIPNRDQLFNEHQSQLAAHREHLRSQARQNPTKFKLTRNRIIPIKPPKPPTAHVSGRKRGRPGFAYAAANSERTPKLPLNVGMLAYECEHCKALLFPGESKNRCCANGQVKMNPLVPFPEWYNELLYQGDRFEGMSKEKKQLSKFFKKRLKVFNSILSFGSVKFDTRDSGVANQPPLHLVNGNIDFFVSHVMPLNPNEALRNGQLYTINSPSMDYLMNELIKNDFYVNMRGGKVGDQLMYQLYDYIRQNNTLSEGYLMVYDHIQKMQAEKKTKVVRYVMQFVEESNVPPELREPQLHERQKNIPHAPEVAVVFHRMPEDGRPIDDGLMARGLWLFPKSGKVPVKIAYSPVLFTMAFVLVFLHGETPYQLQLPLHRIRRDEDENEDESENKDNDKDENRDVEMDDKTRQQQVQAYQDDLLYGRVEDPTANNEDFFNFETRLDEADREDDDIETRIQAKIIRKREFCSIRQQIRYLMQWRQNDNGVHHIWHLGILGALIVIWIHFAIIRREIDYYANQVEQRKISCKYVRKHYQDLLDKHIPNRELGYVVRVPKYHKTSESYRQRKYHQALAICRQFGSPTFFITLTSNPQWEDYRAACNAVGIDNSPDLMNRVFEARLKLIMREFTGSKNSDVGIFGKCIAYVVSIEHQKRGMPHAHILLWIEDHEVSADYVDRYISARIPDPKENPELHALVVKYMTHVCGPDAVCRDRTRPGNPCMKHYPMEPYMATQVAKGLVKYKRLLPNDGGFTAQKKYRREVRTLNDRNVVPYNPYLLRAWDGHSNVEFCVTNGTPAYVLKYIMKGSSKVFFEVVKGGLENNPFVTERDGKIDIDMAKYYYSKDYITIEQAHLNIISVAQFFLSHNVIFVGVHLPKDVNIISANGEAVEKVIARVQAMSNDCYSRLTAYFKYCRENPEETANTTYTELNRICKYDAKKLQYTPLKRASKCIVAMYEVSVKNIQLMALRTILLSVPGLKSFKDAATFNGRTYYIEGIEGDDNEEDLDFVSAAQARGLLESDQLWRNALDQRKHCTVRRFIFLFAQVLLEGRSSIENPLQLWKDYKRYMMPPFGFGANLQNIEERRLRSEQIALSILQWYLAAQRATLAEFGLPTLNGDTPAYNPDDYGNNIDRFVEQFGEVTPDDANEIPEIQLDPQQQHVFNTILEAIKRAPAEKSNIKPEMFFIHAGGGTGKTTTLCQLIRYCRLNGLRVIPTATTGIAASLLPGGTTLHSRLHIPTHNLQDGPRMPFECPAARILRDCTLLLVDEASQLSIETFNFVLQTLENVRYPGNEVKRRLVIVFSGDFRQLLPVIQRGKIDDCFNASLINTYGGNDIKFLALTHNHRANEDEVDLRNFLMEISENTNSPRRINRFTTEIQLPEQIRRVNSVNELIESVFPAALMRNEQWQRSAIVAPHNSTVDEINNIILKRLPGKLHTYKALNYATEEFVNPEDDTAVDAMQESMAIVNETGLPEQTLNLKVGAQVMIIKNICTSAGLCNGTPGIVRELSPDVITIQLIGHDGKLGELVDIVRCRFERKADVENNKMLNFTRIQFPLKLAFAMTVHKVQGQTLHRIGILFSSQMFTPGQAYVAFSRVRRMQDISYFHPNGNNVVNNVTHPGVVEFLERFQRGKQ